MCITYTNIINARESYPIGSVEKLIEKLLILSQLLFKSLMILSIFSFISRL